VVGGGNKDSVWWKDFYSIGRGDEVGEWRELV